MSSTTWFLVILLAVNYCLAEDKFTSNKVRTRQVNRKQPSDVGESGTEMLHRQERSWGAFFLTGFSHIVKATSLGLTLGSALTGGCMYFPSICENEKEIERLDGEIKIMTRKYEEEYIQSKERFYNLQTATTNNGYIEYYINQTLQAVQTLQEIESGLTIYLQVNLPKLSEMDDATANQTFKEYLGLAIGTLEYQLSDLKKLILRHKKTVLIGIVIQFVVEATINRFVSSLKTAIKVVPNALNGFIIDKMGANKLASKVINQMAKNVGKSVRNFWTDLKKLITVKTWKEFKSRMTNVFKPALKKLQKVKNNFTPSKIKANVENKKFSMSKTIMTTLGILADGIATAVQVKQWREVAGKMERARQNYQQYHDNLSNELQAVANETVKMEVIWTEIVFTFQQLCIPFKQLVENSTNFSNFSDVIGLPKLPIDTSGPLFSINFNSITKESINSQQLNVIQFLKKVNNNMTEIHDELFARTLMYNNTLSKTKKEEPVGEMQSDIKSILQFSSSGTIRKFGDALTLSDMVCTVSILRYDLEEYDYFPIAAFRPRCDVNITTFEHWTHEAYTKRKSKLMRNVITQYVNNNKPESLSMLVDAVHNAYLGVADKHIASYGKLITARDVICVIADTFTNFSMYDFVNLNSLRPDCSTVSTGQFNKILEDANKLRAVTLAVESALDVCRQYKFCPCLSIVASTNNVDEKVILIALHYIDSSWQPNTEAQYCGDSECECLHL